MASKLIIVVFLGFVSLSLTSGYSVSTRNAVSKQDDESYVIDQESSMVVVNKAVSKISLRKGLKWKWSPKWKPKSPKRKPKSPKWKPKSPTRKQKSPKQKDNKISSIIKPKIKKIGALSVGAFAGIIIGAIVIAIVIIVGICFLLGGCLCFSRKAKKAQSAAEAEQETATDKTNDSSKPQTLKKEDV